MLAARGPAGRLTRVWSYVEHHRKDDEQAQQEAQGFRPAALSHPHHLPSQGSG